MPNNDNKPKTHIEVKADKRAAALKANMQRRKGFVKSQKEQDNKSNNGETNNAEPTND